MKKYITQILKSIAQAIVIASAVLAGYSILFSEGKVNLTSKSLKQVDSIVKAAKVQTDSIYRDTTKFK